MKMEPIVSSETSAIRTPGNYPKRNKLHLEHGESLKTRICIFLFLSLPVGGRLMAVPLQMFPPTARNKKCLYALSEMSGFYYLRKTGTFGVPNRIGQDSGMEIFKTPKKQELSG